MAVVAPWAGPDRVAERGLVIVDVLAPVSRPDEVEPLARAGATDLYCGLYDEVWIERWGLGAWPNRRGAGPGNLASRSELGQVAAQTRRSGLRLHLAINTSLTDADQEHALLDLARHACDEHVYGLIVGNPALIPHMPGVHLTASTLCGTHNVEAVRFLAERGADRVILSRQLALDEIRAIRAAVDVELEAFALNDACVFEESTCHTAHAIPQWGGPYCLSHRSSSDAGFDAEVAARRPWLDALGDRELGSTGLPRGPCGLCALPALAEMGMDGVKIVGREAHPYRKVRTTQMVRHVLQSYEEGGERLAKERALALRNDPDGCRSGLHCYYPEVRPDHD